jgi:hypothetical protein
MEIDNNNTFDNNGHGNYFIANVSDSYINRTIKNAVDAGSCNFCNRPHKKVNVVTGVSQIEVRFCNKCLKELSNYR